jgi:hypothetical protein
MLTWCCTTVGRKFIKFSRGLEATSSSPMGCETRGVEAGKTKISPSELFILVIQVTGFTLVNNINSFSFKLLSECSRTYHPASLLSSQRKVNMKLNKICKGQKPSETYSHMFTVCDVMFRGSSFGLQICNQG